MPHLAKLNEGDTVTFDFAIPDSWKNREVFIVFEGKNLNFSYYANNQIIDVVRDTHNFAEWRISKTIKLGSNTLKFKAAGDSNQFFQAYLYATPKLLISNYRADSDLDGSFTNGLLNIVGEVRNLDKRDYYKYTIEFALYDAQGKQVFSEKSPAFSFGKSKNKTKGINYNRMLPNIQKWSLSNPYLYTLIINMRDGDDNTELEILSKKIGFKSVVVDAEGLLLNGLKRPLNASKPLLNLTKIRADSLRTIILSLKRANTNIAFTAGYTPLLWVEKCLQLGLITMPDSSNLYQIDSNYKVECLNIAWRDSTKREILLNNFNLESDNEYAIVAWELKKESKTIQSGNIKIDFPIGTKKRWLLPESMLKIKDYDNLRLCFTLKIPRESFWHSKQFVLLKKELEWLK